VLTAKARRFVGRRLSYAVWHSNSTTLTERAGKRLICRSNRESGGSQLADVGDVSRLERTHLIALKGHQCHRAATRVLPAMCSAQIVPCSSPTRRSAPTTRSTVRRAPNWPSTRAAVRCACSIRTATSGCRPGPAGNTGRGQLRQPDLAASKGHFHARALKRSRTPETADSTAGRAWRAPASRCQPPGSAG
jgi:hypothetical protein